MTSDESPGAPAARSYEAVLRSIETDLKGGKIKVGDQIPGERALAQIHGISRASVRDAIRILEVMGVVRTAVGSGPASGTVVIANPSAGLGSALRLHMATSLFPVADIVQTRIMMETWAAREAAARSHDAAVIEQVRGLMAAMDNPDLEREAFHVLDAQFHVLLSSLAGNVVITAMMESLRLAIQGYVSDAIDSDAMWQQMVPALRQQHRGIVTAVTGHDGEAAAAALKEHIEWFHAQTLPMP
ncbi:GntR family transcriptional regulator [Arthrobacter sp. ERGS1:01]|uniref:FadR/GntR family transcriptional regulator n=1 Tax=Arthrobacter sp. ERGS1:01 TaxID=1704044 RepID=UPI0006B41FF7|nr:FCD domain-containing protein [Arthrobacter sp. ERGS1:01]ALE06142.1 GntR family transcriptional regulator [Arthrobacter sp. ERGS1:01]